MTNAGFRLARRFAATPRDHRLLFQSCSSQRQRRFGFITERHRSRVELKSTVCDLPRWEKRQGYRSIGKTLLAAWSSLCGKWRLRSYTNIIIEAAMCGERQASLKAALYAEVKFAIHVHSSIQGSNERKYILQNELYRYVVLYLCKICNIPKDPGW